MPHGNTASPAPLLLLLSLLLSSVLGRSYPRFARNDTVFQHLALHPDPAVGTVYVGARDRLFQLDGLDGLRLEQEETTGPLNDSKECLPPVTESNCQQARRTSNHNKLLLVDTQAAELITCGSVHQGTCQKRSLASVGRVLFSTERPVDTQYVAANDPQVSTVGLVVGPRGQGGRTVMYVGRGYTANHPPISTRHLSSEPFFSYEETAKLAVAGRLSEYDHHFVAAFARRSHVYFLFYRRDLKAPSREYRTYAARVCLDDASYYSYVEVPLVCRAPSSSSPKSYSLLQAAQVGQGGGPAGEALLGVFSSRVSFINSNPSDASAFCVFPLDELDHRIDSTRDLCYTQDGRVEGGGEVAYIEYQVKSSCAILPTNTLKAYPCGSDHTPSPMASRVALEAEAVLHSPAARLTAVAVSPRDGHSIAFLGDSKGKLHKVFLGPGGRVETYATATIQPNSPIHSDLLLDPSGAHIYIMTSTAVEKRPVAECGDHLDCQSCLAAKDPYCGWCVLEGRCGQRQECQRGPLRGQWLWSYDPGQQCLSVQDLNVYNTSRGQRTDISVSVTGLPGLGEGEAYSCFFQDTETSATLTVTGVTCPTPDAGSLPPIGHGDDSVMVTLSLRFLNVTVAETEFTFYNCSLVQQLSGRRPCQGCVSSRWGCNWCIHQHVCTHRHTCERGITIYNHNFKPPTPTNSPTTQQPPRSPSTVTIVTPPTTVMTTTAPQTTTSTTTTTTTTETTTTPQPPSSIPPITTTTTTTVTPQTSLDTTSAHTPARMSSPSVGLPSQSTTTTTSTVRMEVTAGDRGTTSGGEGEDQLVTEAETLDFSNRTEVKQAPLETTPSGGASARTEADPSPLEPSGESAGSFFDASSITSSEASLSAELIRRDGKEAVPLADSEETDSAVWMRDWDLGAEEKTETEAETVPTGPSVTSNSERSFSQTQTPDPHIEPEPGPVPAALYQSDSLALPKSPECPCVEKVQGSSLLPVNVEKKITLVGQHLHLFEDEDLDYECVLDIENVSVVVDASVETDPTETTVFLITCLLHQYTYAALVNEYQAVINVRRRNNFQIDSAEDLHVTLFNCSVGRSDCSRCRTADPKLGCVWCGDAAASRCVYGDSCLEEVKQTCPAPLIFSIDPVSGPVEGGTVVTISGSNLGQRAEDIQSSLTVAGVPCHVIHSRYEVSSRIVCETTGSGGEKSGQVSVKVRGGGHGLSSQTFSFQNPVLSSIFPRRGPKAGGSDLSIRGQRLRTGHPSEVSVLIGGVPCLVKGIQDDQINCLSGGSNRTGEHAIAVRFGGAERHLQDATYHYTPNPNITMAAPSKSFLRGGRIIRVTGQNLDVVQEPKIQVTLSPPDTLPPRRRKRGSRSTGDTRGTPGRWRRSIPEPDCPEGTLCVVKQDVSPCTVSSSSLILCPTPAVGPEAQRAQVKVHFLLDSLQFDFGAVGGQAFSYEPNPVLYPLNKNHLSKPYHHKPGSIISVEGVNLDLAIYKEEVMALIGEGVCAVKTLTHNHLYCEPPAQQPSVAAGRRQEGMDGLPEFTVQMGNLNFSLGRVQYDSQAQATFPREAQVGVGVGASIVALIVLIIVLIYRRKSKQALRDYKKVQIQLENLETSVRDRCKKEFTDLMTEMMDMSSDLVGSGIPFLEYRAYAERIFFPGHQDSPLRRDLDVPESRRQTVEQGLVQLSNLLNSKLFLTKFIHTLEVQRTFSPRDRAYVASLLTVALHGKLEYFTDILKTLLNDLVEQYVAKNPKLMLRRTESVVEKLLTNWMSICLFTFLRESAGESFYMLFRAIKHQVDKGPVDAVTGKAKYTLNDNRLLREDVEYRTLTLNVLMAAAGANGVATTQTVPAKVLDCDTITQVKEKLLEQTWKGTSFSQRPHVDSLHLEWRAGVAGHLILSDEDLTSVVQGSWKRLNTLQHYKVPDGATVALVPRNTKHHHHDSHDYMPGEKTPMLDDGEEGGVRLWHLVKANEEAELPKQRRGSMRERGGERAKAIPEIYLTRLLSMKGTLQKFVDDLFTAILSTSRPVPLAVKYFFDMLDEQALLHNIADPETIHIWKTNSLPLRFWINILKNPQFIFDVQASDHVDAVLSVIAQTFMDSCTIAEHKLGRDSPINKLLYARDIPRYKQMVERYYADIRQTISASDQEMNSALAELSRNYAGEVNYLVALHELYKYINKYYDQIVTALEEDPTAQKMQLGYRLQQIAAAVENKVTDL